MALVVPRYQISLWCQCTLHLTGHKRLNYCTVILTDSDRVNEQRSGPNYQYCYGKSGGAHMQIVVVAQSLLEIKCQACAEVYKHCVQGLCMHLWWLSIRLKAWPQSWVLIRPTSLLMVCNSQLEVTQSTGAHLTKNVDFTSPPLGPAKYFIALKRIHAKAFPRQDVHNLATRVTIGPLWQKFGLINDSGFGQGATWCTHDRDRFLSQLYIFGRLGWMCFIHLYRYWNIKGRNMNVNGWR